MGGQRWEGGGRDGRGHHPLRAPLTAPTAYVSFPCAASIRRGLQLRLSLLDSTAAFLATPFVPPRLFLCSLPTGIPASAIWLRAPRSRLSAVDASHIPRLLLHHVFAHPQRQRLVFSRHYWRNTHSHTYKPLEGTHRRTPASDWLSLCSPPPSCVSRYLVSRHPLDRVRR